MTNRPFPSFSPTLGLVALAVMLALPACATRAPASRSAVSNAPATAPTRPESQTLASWDGERPRRIVAVHRRKCGACHTRVEPGSVPRGEAEAAMRRHRQRARLTEQEWNDMVEYISDDGGLHGRPTAHLP
jgi:cytochrome c5